MTDVRLVIDRIEYGALGPCGHEARWTAEYVTQPGTYPLTRVSRVECVERCPA